MNEKRFEFSGHAIRRMFEREISVEDVKQAVQANEVIAAYPDDKPLPSRLLFHRGKTGVTHVIAAFDAEHNTEIIISVYRPDPLLWDATLRHRK